MLAIVVRQVPVSVAYAIWAGLACSPCVNAFNNRQTACRDNVCMQAITVDQVFETVGRIYRQRTPIEENLAVTGIEFIHQHEQPACLDEPRVVRQGEHPREIRREAKHMRIQPVRLALL